MIVEARLSDIKSWRPQTVFLNVMMTNLKLLHSNNLNRPSKHIWHATGTNICCQYCTVLYSGISQGSSRYLQMLQNAAALLITGAKKYNHPLRTLPLHWLPDFKMSLLIFKALNGLALKSILDLLTSRWRRFADGALLVTLRSQMVPQHFGTLCQLNSDTISLQLLLKC